MIYAVVLACAQSACVAYTGPLSPHETAEACTARAHVMRGAVAWRYQATPGVTVRAFCGDLDSIRRVAPGAFPDAVAEVWL